MPYRLEIRVVNAMFALLRLQLFRVHVRIDSDPIADRKNGDLTTVTVLWNSKTWKGVGVVSSTVGEIFGKKLWCIFPFIANGFFPKRPFYYYT